MNGSRQPLVGLSNAAFGYDRRPVVRVDRLSLYRGRCLGVFGHNGSGKTTLVRGLLGLLPLLDGVRARATGEELRYGFLSQYRSINTDWPMSGLDAAMLAVSGRGRFGFINKEGVAAVRRAMQDLAVTDLADRSFATLSGGQQQRLLLAGALADRPDVLVLDEPTDGLDAASRTRLLDLLGRLKIAGLAIVLISHDLDDLLAIGDDVLWLRPGDDATKPSTATLLTPQELLGRLTAGGVS